MGMFHEWLDCAAQRSFGQDASGRSAFFPYGWRKPGYYVEAGDVSKIKSLVKLYALAAALINLVGSTAALAFTEALIADEQSSPLRRKLELGLSVYAIAGLLSYILPLLLLWRVYRDLVASLCSPLTPVGAETIHPMQSSWNRRTPALLAFICLLLLGAAIVLAVSYRR